MGLVTHFRSTVIDWPAPAQNRAPIETRSRVAVGSTSSPTVTLRCGVRRGGAEEQLVEVGARAARAAAAAARGADLPETGKAAAICGRERAHGEAWPEGQLALALS